MAKTSALLLPPGSMLLPPSGILPAPTGGSTQGSDAPPTDEQPAAPSDRAAAEAGAMASRAGAEAKLVVERMAGIAADKIPAIKQRAGELATSASAALADCNRRNAFITSHKQALVVGAAALLVLSGIGYFVARQQATAVARNRIDQFLNTTGLASILTYTDISASPFGTATLTGVTVKGPDWGVVGKVDTMEISGIKMNGDVLSAANLSAKSFEFPVVDLARRYREVPMVAEAMGLGYSTLKGTIALSVVFDDAKKTLFLSMKGDVRDMGTIDASVKFGGTSSSLVEPLFAMAQSGQQTDPQEFATRGIAALQSVAQTTLVEADVAVDNAGWFQREREITDSNMPGDGSAPPSLSANGRKSAVAELERAGMAPSNAEAAIEADWKWSTAGGPLRMTTHIDQPIPLLRSSGFLGGPTFAFDSLPKFLAVTKAKVSN
jgi:hypothetical protein